MIGIITFHDNYNFGAALQCASLNEVVRELGYEPEVIDYSVFNVQRGVLRGWGLRQYGVLKALKKRLRDLKYGPSTVRNFSRFRNRYYVLSPRCGTPNEVANLAQKYSHVICGSDQVWRFDRPGPYFLDLGPKYEGVKVSYAPCCTSLEQPEFQKEKVRSWIEDIDHLSVRNQFSHEHVRNLCGREAEVVADPTILAQLDEDTDGLKDVKLPPQYILAYVLGSQPKNGMAAVIRRARAVHGNIPVLAIRITLDGYHEVDWADITLDGMGPYEWVQLISKAKFFITDSFHGVIFSIKSRTPFFAFYAEEWRSPRLIDLRERYLLGNRISNDPEEFTEELFSRGPDTATLDAIESHRLQSLAFLKKALNTNERNGSAC